MEKVSKSQNFLSSKIVISLLHKTLINVKCGVEDFGISSCTHVHDLLRPSSSNCPNSLNTLM